MDLQELLEVQVGHLLTVLGAEELRELGVRHNAALERGIKAAVGLHVGRNELGHIRLGALGLGRETHEARQLIRDGAELEEGVVRATSVVRGALLGGHRGGVLANTALGVAGLTLDGLRRLRHIAEQAADGGGHIGVQGAHTLRHARQDRIGRAGLGGYGRRHSRNRGRGRSRGRDDGDINGGGGGGLGGRLLRGDGGLRSGGHRVCSIGGVGARHF